MQEQQELKSQLNEIQEPDPKNLNKQGIINIDIFLSIVLAIYRKLVNKTKLFAVNAFNAADLNDDKVIELYEFLILYRYIESFYISFSIVNLNNLKKMKKR